VTQRRIWNYGDTFTSERAATQVAALHEPGVYTGYALTLVDTDTMSFSPGFLLLPSGILVGESVDFQLRISPLPAGATNYTITCRHTDRDLIGGQAALYAIETGLIPQSSITDGVAIAYIRYPGGAVPLAYSQIFPARPVSLQAEDSPQLVPTVFLAPFGPKWIVSVQGPNTTLAEVYAVPRVFTRIETDGLGPVPPGFETTVAILPVVAQKFRPVSFVIRAVIDPNSVMQVNLRDTDGNLVVLSGSTLPPSPTFSDFTVSVNSASGVFTQGDSYTLELSFLTPALDSVDLQSLTINYDPLP